MALTAKQARFAEEYLVDLNATQAAIRAGYSEATAHAIGHENLGKPEIADAIAAAQAERANRTQITADRVLAELGCLGLYDPADIASTPMNGPEDIGKLPEPARRAIAGWGYDREGRFTVKLSPKVPALVEIGKHLGVAQRQELTGKDGKDLLTGDQVGRSKLALALIGTLHAALDEAEVR
jgi:phage terminase small subunit